LPLILGSLSAPVINLAINVIGSLGLAGVAAMNAMSGVVGVPGTEPTMLFAGFNVFDGHLTLVGIIVAGLIGDLVGATIAYGIGYYGRRELLERHGAKIHLNVDRLDRTGDWLERRGAWLLAVGRLIPFARALFPYAAGVAEVAYLKFISLTALGSVIWITGLALLGRQVGSNWQSWRRHLEYVDYAVLALLAAGIVWLLYRRSRASQRAAGVDAVGK
jgi:membrane protein DedA with SNARE-associated domain